MKNTANIRVSPEFKDFLFKIKKARFDCGKERFLLSDRRLTLALTRVPKLEEFVINSDIPETKKYRRKIIQ